MRNSPAPPILVLFLTLGLGMPVSAQTTPPACTGLCLQQITCSGNATTLSLIHI